MARRTTRASRWRRIATRGAKTAAATAREPVDSNKGLKPHASPPGKKRTTEVDRVIGAKIRMRRGELGLTQTQLANAIGVTFQQVQKYEQGANRVGGSRLARVAEALDVPVAYFFEQTADEAEVALGSLLHTRGAVALLRAFANIRAPAQRTALIDVARAIAGEAPQDGSGRPVSI